MLNLFSQNSFSPQRLIFQTTPEKTPETSEKKELPISPEKKTLLDIQARARQIKREDAKKTVIEDAKTRAETKAQFRGLKLTTDEPKNSPDGQLVQEFTFGDKNLNGKLILPKNNDPTKPTSYLFDFSEHPTENDLNQLQKSIAKNQDKLGNTIIVQIKLPDGDAVEVNGKKANLIKSMTEDLKFYQNLPELAKLQQASTVLAISEPEKAEKIKAMLEAYNLDNQSGNAPKALPTAFQIS
ncbi:MAG: hypothetical protein ACRCZE_04975, partial [Candidatus Altimarinota bacterium]